MRALIALRLLACLLVLAGLVVGRPSAVMAEPDLAPILQEFDKDSFSATNRAVIALGASGASRAAVILNALGDEHLFVSPTLKRVLIAVPPGGYVDAATGSAITNVPADLKSIRLNNRVRATLGAALGTLRLRAADVRDRRDAARLIFQRHDPTALPALEAALAQESDGTVRQAMIEARAALVASQTSAPEPERVAALKIVAAHGGLDALAVVDTVLADSTGAVRDAAAAARDSVQTRLTLWSGARNALYGLSLGSILLLAAIGLAITFGVMGVINMAHGEMVMIGAYTTYVVQQLIRDHAPALFQYSLFIALPAAFVLAGLVGILIEKLVIRFLYGRPLETLLATYGVSLILQQAVRSIFGANNKDVAAPDFMSGAVELGGLTLTQGRMWIIAFALVIFFGLQAILRLTPFGLRMRAVTQNRRMAAAMGIDTNRMDALAFGLGSGVAGIAGVALSQIDNVSPNLGQSYIIDAFMVVVFGGVGNLWGTLVAAFTLGIGNKLLEPVAGAVLGKIAILVFIVLFIQRRPRGLFALKGRAVEA